MGQFALENKTPLAAEALALTDEEWRPLLVVVVKATYSIGSDGLRLADEQVPVNVAGAHWGAPEDSSYKFEPECAFTKPTTDVVLVGHAHAPTRNTSELLVELQVGTLRKAVRVLGERVWSKSLGQVSMTKPLPFERIPLRYERAFGGWDRTDPDPAKHQFEPRNPVGVGFRSSPRHFQEGLRLPNLEAPEQPLRHFGQVVVPVGFGFLSPHWAPRASLGGTYDEKWDKLRKPLLPKDFDRRFFNAASTDLIAPAYLRGGELVSITNASPRGRLSFRLPRLTPQLKVGMARGEKVTPPLNLDTVIFDTDEHRMLLLWRATLALSSGIHEVRELELHAPDISP